MGKNVKFNKRTGPNKCTGGKVKKNSLTKGFFIFDFKILIYEEIKLFLTEICFDFQSRFFLEVSRATFLESLRKTL